VDEKTFFWYKDLNKLKETFSVREEVFNTNLSKLKSESLQLKQRIESLVYENSQLIEKLKRAESGFTTNKRWNYSAKALKWLNTRHNRNKKGLGFITRSTANLVNKKYVGLQELFFVFTVVKRVIIVILVR